MLTLSLPLPAAHLGARDSRARTGRLRLPQRVSLLTPADEPALSLVNAFADRLAELPIIEWLSIGRRVTAMRTGTPSCDTAFTNLQRAIADHSLGVAAWYARDAVETSAFLASSVLRRWTTLERREFAAAHGAAEDAALALLARDRLAVEEFSVLVSPFQAIC